MTDEELMQAYLSGDPEAFDVLYRKYSGKTYAYLKRRLNSAEETDEVFQSVFLKLHQSRFGYDVSYPFVKWLFVIAKTTLIDFWRKQGRQVPIAEDVPFDAVLKEELSQTQDGLALKEQREIEILDDLPSEQRKAVEMRVLDEMSYEQIAKRLNRSQDNVRQMVSRALKKMRFTARLDPKGSK